MPRPELPRRKHLRAADLLNRPTEVERGRGPRPGLAAKSEPSLAATLGDCLPDNPQPEFLLAATSGIAVLFERTPDHADIDHDRFHPIGELLYLEILPVAAA